MPVNSSTIELYSPWGVQERRNDNFVQTYTGKKFWPAAPREEDVDHYDIAHSLSMQCRYAGHCKEFYSVAEHGVLLFNYAYLYYDDPLVWWWALHHDDSEAYMVDLPRPVKQMMPDYRAGEKNVMDVIANNAGVPRTAPKVVKELDGRIISDERANLVDMDWGYETPEPLGIKLKLWSPREAELAYLSAQKTLEHHGVGKCLS